MVISNKHLRVIVGKAGPEGVVVERRGQEAAKYSNFVHHHFQPFKCERNVVDLNFQEARVAFKCQIGAALRGKLIILTMALDDSEQLVSASFCVFLVSWTTIERLFKTTMGCCCWQEHLLFARLSNLGPLLASRGSPRRPNQSPRKTANSDIIISR